MYLGRLIFGLTLNHSKGNTIRKHKHATVEQEIVNGNTMDKNIENYV
jgi:hypothetical protein